MRFEKEQIEDFLKELYGGEIGSLIDTKNRMIQELRRIQSDKGLDDLILELSLGTPDLATEHIGTGKVKDLSDATVRLERYKENQIDSLRKSILFCSAKETVARRVENVIRCQPKKDQELLYLCLTHSNMEAVRQMSLGKDTVRFRKAMVLNRVWETANEKIADCDDYREMI